MKDLKASLETEQADLQEIEGPYENQKSTSFIATLESKTAEVANLDAMIQEAARLAAEKAAEEQRKAQEEAARQQQNNANTAVGQGNNNTTAPENSGGSVE